MCNTTLSANFRAGRNAQEYRHLDQKIRFAPGRLIDAHRHTPNGILSPTFEPYRRQKVGYWRGRYQLAEKFFSGFQRFLARDATDQPHEATKVASEVFRKL